MKSRITCYPVSDEGGGWDLPHRDQYGLSWRKGADNSSTGGGSFSHSAAAPPVSAVSATALRLRSAQISTKSRLPLVSMALSWSPLCYNTVSWWSPTTMEFSSSSLFYCCLLMLALNFEPCKELARVFNWAVGSLFAVDLDYKL